MKKIMVTGGAGFIGSALVRYLINQTDSFVMNFDKLTYAGNLNSLKSVENSHKYKFVHGDICDFEFLLKSMTDFMPDYIFNLAAETHVDRSLNGPKQFIDTNIIGTFNILEASRLYLKSVPSAKAAGFRLLHVSTDEVFGSLSESGLFTEQSRYDPSSPYSASKAASDHLVRSWQHTYDLPTIVSNCSNNYGPFHFPEKLIPLNILNALEGKPITIYGSGANIRDWLYVDDHVRALYLICQNGEIGETYNVGGNNQHTNLEVIELICNTLAELLPQNTPYSSLITFVPDRPGHDFRYAIDATKITQKLGWMPQETFHTGIQKTVKWYLSNESWWRPIREFIYDGKRLGNL